MSRTRPGTQSQQTHKQSGGRKKKSGSGGGNGPSQLVFDFAEAQRRAEIGTAQALMSERGASWAERAQAWLAECDDEPFTSEDICAAIGLPNGTAAANRNNAVGAFIRACARTGKIVKAGYDHCHRPESHGAIITVWRSSHGAAMRASA